MPTSNRVRLLAAAIACSLVPTAAQAATVAADGGVTLWISYGDSSASEDPSVDDTVDVVDATAGGFSCDATDTGRSDVGAGPSPGSCPGGASSCTGQEKITGDLERFAGHLFEATEGAHYVRRVYVADEGRSWDSADVQWDLAEIGSSAAPAGWRNVGRVTRMRSTERRCIHDVLNHEIGHYLYNLPDRYERAESANYYRGSVGGSAPFPVGVTERDINTVMSNNFPHRFVDGTNARIRITYNPPGPVDVNAPGEVLTPDLLTDADANNDGPNWARFGFTMPFALDEWSLLPDEHVDLASVHIEGEFPVPDAAAMPAVDIRFIGDDEPAPGTVLLLDRSGSMGVTTSGVPASQFVQEAGLYLYHSASETDFVATHLYNGSVEELFDYGEYDPTNTLPMASFRNASGLTNIAAALESGIDALVDEHGEGGANGGLLFLMSDGKQTTGPDLWDQVTRASELGIRINTFAFGNADVATMNDIASQTSGEVIEVSERTDAAELKLHMTREMSEARGHTPIFTYKGSVKSNAEVQGSEAFERAFVVPPGSRQLQMYLFTETGNAARHRLQLVDPTGVVTEQPANSVAVRGRFNGARVAKPTPGEWRVRIVSARGKDGVLASTGAIELVGYADNRLLDVEMAAPQLVDGKGLYRIEATAVYAYPLAGLLSRLHVYAAGAQVATLKMYDDGVNGGDRSAGDGVYTILFDEADARRFRDGKGGSKYRFDVEMTVLGGSRPAPAAHYETGARYGDLVDSYLELTKGLNQPFTAWATRFGAAPTKDVDVRLGVRIDWPQDTLDVRPGDRGIIEAVLLGSNASHEQLRASLGDDVAVRVLRVDPIEGQVGSNITFKYEVGRQASDGERALRLQAGAGIASAPAVLRVKRLKQSWPRWPRLGGLLSIKPPTLALPHRHGTGALHKHP